MKSSQTSFFSEAFSSFDSALGLVTVNYEGSLASELGDEKIHHAVSYEGHLQSLDEFLQEKSKRGLGALLKARGLFGEYQDCFALVKKPIYFSEKEKGVLSLRFSSSGNRLIGGFGSGAIRIYNSKTFSEESVVVLGKENGYAVTCVRFLKGSDNRFYASTAEGFIMSYDIERDDLSIVIAQNNNEIHTFDINFNNLNLITGGSNHGINVYDLNTYVSLSSFINKSFAMYNVNQNFHTNQVHAVKFLPEEQNLFLSGGWDNNLKLWDLRVRSGCVQTVVGPHISGDAIDVAGPLLLAGSWEPRHSLYLFDLRQFSLLNYVMPVNSMSKDLGVYTFGACFYNRDPTGDLILRASLGTKTVDVISIKQNVILHSYFSEQSCVTVDSYGSNIAYGGTHNCFNYALFFMNLLVDYRDKYVHMDDLADENVEEEVNEEEKEQDDWLDEP